MNCKHCENGKCKLFNKNVTYIQCDKCLMKLPKQEGFEDIMRQLFGGFKK